MRPDLSVSGRSSFPDVILLGYLGPIYEEACMAKAEKATAVADIAEQFKDSTATLVTEYRGLTVANLKDLRRSLGDSATYTVAKNTLVKRAAAEAGIEGLDELFVGPTAIAFVKGEAVDAAKAIKKFAKDNKALVIKGGYMDGRAAERFRGRKDRRPGIARGAAGQAGRRDEGQSVQGRRSVQRSGVSGRTAVRCTAREEGLGAWSGTRRRSSRRGTRRRSPAEASSEDQAPADAAE